MSRFWNQLTRGIKPYVPGEQPQDKKYIKLNTNESPYPPSPKVLEAASRAADERLRLYPDPECTGLREVVAAYHDLEKDEVFIGNGSDEVLAFAFMTFFETGKKVLFPDITYSFYPVYGNLFRLDYERIPLEEDFSIPVDRFFGENGGIVLANPNAPTGKYLPLEDVRRILDNNRDSVVILDEAYIDFGGESAVSLIPSYDNLLVIQTLSKSRSLAGLRIGFAMGHKDLIQGLNRVKNSMNSYTLDRIALAAAVEAFRDVSYFEENRHRIMATRNHVVSALSRMGFHVIPSMANFVFIHHPDMAAVRLFTALRERGILVRHFKEPRIDEYLRISIGSEEEMDEFLRVTGEIVNPFCEPISNV